MKDPEDPYDTGACRWWHLSQPSPELAAAAAEGAIGEHGVVVDLGCGLGTEVGYLAGQGWHGLGVDLSAAALEHARSRQCRASFARADATSLPLATASVDLLIDRGCFHYLAGLRRLMLASDTRTMPALMALLIRKDTYGTQLN